MTIDEVEKIYKAITNEEAPCPRYCMLPCDKCVQECKQVLEWLEELKDYRKNKGEYNGGWIPCSERFPEEKDGVVLICDENGEVETGRYSEFSNQWYIGDMCAIGGSKVIAWQPLPQAYKEGE